MSFTIDQKYYNQKQGLFIGAPTSPFLQKFIFKEWKKIIFILCSMPLVYDREKLTIHLQ